MKLGFYAIKDELAGHFMAPTLFMSKAIAEREFRNSLKEIPVWRNNPQDYSLYKLGEYNEETGEIKPKIEMIGGGRAYV